MTPPIDWPVVTIGKHRLILRWTFYAKWLLSQRKVDIRHLNQDSPEIVANLMEIFAAMVAENFKDAGHEPPTAEYWASAINDNGGDEKWIEANKAISDAIAKARPAANTPGPQETATAATGVN